MEYSERKPMSFIKLESNTTMRVAFDSKANAISALDELYMISESNGRASVYTFFSLCWLDPTEDDKVIGWDFDEIANAKIIKDKHGCYLIILPDPHDIKPLAFEKMSQ